MKPSRKWWWSSASLLALLAAVPAAATIPSTTHLAPPALVEALLVVSINGVEGSESVTLLRDSGTNFYAPRSIIAACRLTKAVAPAFTRDGVEYYLLNAIDGLKLEFNEAEQTLAITARVDMLKQTTLAYADVAMTDEIVGGTGGFINYDITAQVADGETSAAGAVEAGIFSPWGVGTTNFIAHWSNGVASVTRLATNWTIDDPTNMRSLRLGDSVSRGGVGGAPLRFSGIQFGRNFEVAPGFVTIPLPSIQGSAALPSVVDVYVNGTRSGSRDLPAGSFQITEVPILTGAGDIQLVVRDLLGRETLFSQPYYVAATLLGEGLHDYSYEVGLLRQSFGLRSNDYGAMMVSATHRYGFSNTITGELHGEATKDVQVAGAAVQMVLGNFGYLETATAASRSERGNGVWNRVGFERRTRGLSFGANAELSSKDYTSVGRPSGDRSPASVIQAFVGLPLHFGSLGLSYLRRDSRGEPDAEYASASASVLLGRRASLQLAARKSMSGKEDLAAQVSLSLALPNRAHTSTGLSVSDGEFRAVAAIEKYRPVGEGFGYRIAASSGSFTQLDGSISANSRFGSHEVQLTWTDGRTGVRLSTAGGIGLIGQSAFVSRPLNQSFARVKVGDYENVRVYADNQLVGRTDSEGTLILPKLRPFDRNIIRIDLADLPMDAQISGDERRIRPFGRHGVLVDFNARPARAAIIRVHLADGTFLPAGSAVLLNGGTAAFISAPGGEVYLTGVAPRNSAVATWSDGSCQLHFDYVPSDDPQPRLGDVICAGGVQ